jgi:hypothetical protein
MLDLDFLPYKQTMKRRKFDLNFEYFVRIINANLRSLFILRFVIFFTDSGAILGLLFAAPQFATPAQKFIAVSLVHINNCSSS